MSDPQQTTRLIIQLGNGGNPEEFAFTCGANTFGVTLTNNLGEVLALDCDSPLDLPAAITRHLESQDTSVSISGTVARKAWSTWRGWADDGLAKNIKMMLDESAADGGGHWIVPAILQQLELSKEGAKVVQFSASISGAGRRVWVEKT